MRRILPPGAPVVALLGIAAALHLGYHLLVLGLDRRDAGQYETVLARATAGQLVAGPGRLYGPFSGANPSVLMHAPTYYRIVALGAWLPHRLGLDPLDAALRTGRALTVLATLALLALAWRLARLDGGASWRAGFVAAALVASSPILGVLAIMLRPDALGVALATGGGLLVLRTTLADPPPRRPGVLLAAAYAAFALAVGVKQTNVLVPALSTVLLGAAWGRGRVRLAAVLPALGVGLGVGLALLALEDHWTAGRMWRTVFELPGGPFRAVNFGGWDHVATILADCLKRSVGLLALGAVGLAVARRGDMPARLDGLLLVALAAELVALVPLCLFNKGAADNYALQAVVLAAVLVGRRVDRALQGDGLRLLPRAALAAAAAVLLVNDARLIRHAESCRREESAALARLFADPEVARVPAAQRYFVANQGFNRLFGRRELIHDEWLYGAFEAIEGSEPRDAWLRAAVARGPVRQVVTPAPRDGIPGVRPPLPALGYERRADHGPYAVWVRR